MKLNEDIKRLIFDANYSHIEEARRRALATEYFAKAALAMMNEHNIFFLKVSSTSYINEALGITSIYIERDEDGSEMLKLGKNEEKFRKYGNYYSDVLRHVMFEVGRKLYPHFDKLFDEIVDLR